MPVRAFDAYLNERRLVQTQSLSILKGCKVGVDATFFLRRLLQSYPTKEPLASAIGGQPIALRESIVAELKQLKSFGVTPLFVFSGTSLAQTHKKYTFDDVKMKNRTYAWEAYRHGNGEQAVQIFGDVDGFSPANLSKWFQNILRAEKAEFIVAPFSAWAQLAYLEAHKDRFIDAVYGSNELLLFNLDRVITAVNPAKGTFSWVTKKAALYSLGGITNDAFVDVCIFAGFELCNTFPPLETAAPMGFQFRSAADLLRNFRTGMQAVSSFAENPLLENSNYMDRFCRAKVAIRHHIVLNSEGKLVPLTDDDLPSDLHDVLGQRLPDELYFYLSRGLIGPELLKVVLSGAWIEHSPLDNGESVEYRQFLDNLFEMQTISVGLLTQPLNRYFQAKAITAHYWYDQEIEKPMLHRMDQTPFGRINKWNVKDKHITEQLESVSLALPSLRFSVLTLTDTDFSMVSVAAKDPKQLLESTKEVVANVLWRALQLRDFADDQHQLTLWGVALATSYSSSEVEDGFDSALLIAMELVRYKALNDAKFNPEYPDVATSGTEDEQRHILLITRVCGCLRLQHKPIGYTGPLNRRLLAFNSFVTKMTHSLRNLVEMVLVSMFLNGDASRLQRNDWSEIANQLPFTEEVNSGMSIVMKTYLENLTSTEPTPEVCTAKMDALKSYFPQAVDLQADLKRAIRFWDALLDGIKLAESIGLISTSELASFMDADNWLSQRRPR